MEPAQAPPESEPAAVVTEGQTDIATNEFVDGLESSLPLSPTPSPPSSPQSHPLHAEQPQAPPQPPQAQTRTQPQAQSPQVQPQPQSQLQPQSQFPQVQPQPQPQPQPQQSQAEQAQQTPIVLSSVELEYQFCVQVLSNGPIPLPAELGGGRLAPGVLRLVGQVSQLSKELAETKSTFMDDKKAMLQKMQKLVQQFRAVEAKLKETGKQLLATKAFATTAVKERDDAVKARDDAMKSREVMVEDHQRIVNELIAARTTKEETAEQVKSLLTQVREFNTTNQRISAELQDEKRQRMQLQGQWSDLKVENASLKQRVSQLELEASITNNALSENPQQEKNLTLPEAIQKLTQLRTSLECARQQAMIAMQERDEIKARLVVLQRQVMDWGTHAPHTATPAAATLDGVTSSAEQPAGETATANTVTAETAAKQLSGAEADKAVRFMQLWQTEQAENARLQTALRKTSIAEQRYKQQLEQASEEITTLKQKLTSFQASDAEKDERLTKLKALLTQANARAENDKQVILKLRAELKEATPPPWVFLRKALHSRFVVEGAVWCLVRRPSDPAGPKPQVTWWWASPADLISKSLNGEIRDSDLDQMPLLDPLALSSDIRELHKKVTFLQECCDQSSKHEEDRVAKEVEQRLKIEHEFNEYRQRAGRLLKERDSDTTRLQQLQDQCAHTASQLQAANVSLAEAQGKATSVEKKCQLELDEMKLELREIKAAHTKLTNDSTAMRQRHSAEIQALVETHAVALEERNAVIQQLEAACNASTNQLKDLSVMRETELRQAMSRTDALQLALADAEKARKHAESMAEKAQQNNAAGNGGMNGGMGMGGGSVARNVPNSPTSSRSSSPSARSRDDEIRHLQSQLSNLRESVREAEQRRQLERQQEEALKTQIRELQRTNERFVHYGNLEYMKNIVVQYIEMGSDHHDRLFPVLSTLLQFTPDDIQRINSKIKARDRRFWKMS